MFWAVTLLGFFLLFRKSNLVPDTLEGFQGDKQISWGDLQFLPDRVLCAIRWTKTNQFWEEKLVFPLPKMQESKLCPVKALERVINSRVTVKQHHCFRRANGTSFTYLQLNKKLKEVIQKVGEDPTQFSSHSVRHGGCTWAFLSGVPPEMIKLLGNWKSDCYLRYLHYPFETRVAASELMKLRIQAIGL